MFKKLIPVVSVLMFAAGPVLAADPPSSDTTASAPAKSHKKHSHKKKTKAASGTDTSAPK
jgi:hypothetical protein